jgi:hypothetical protein
MIQIELVAGRLSNDGDTFVDGAVLAAARTVPTWSDGDVPPIPSMERKAVKEIQEECQRMLAEFPTTSEQDQKLLGKFAMLILTLCKYCIDNRIIHIMIKSSTF